MKNPRNPIATALIMTSILLSSCGREGNTGNKVTEIDSLRDSNIILQHEEVPDPSDQPAFAPENAVKVNMASASNFDWETFRNELAAKEEAIGEGFRQEENQVATAWEKLNEQYAYQTVYHYRDGELWLQTYYKSNDPSSSTDSLSNEQGQLLTRDGGKNSDLQDLWKKMEERAQEVFRP